MRRLLLAAAAALALSACGHVAGDFCAVEKPVRPSAKVIADMSHDELAAAVAHNRQGERDCGWRP